MTRAPAERYVVFGTGGVGKTTTAAALGVMLARRGRRTLVVTTDPARRLADVLGVVASAEPGPVPWQAGLDCWMPEARAATQSLAADLLVGRPELAAALQVNPVFDLLCSGLAGVHDLATVASLGVRAAAYDAVVIDTAPARHAIELVSLPARLGALLDSRAVQWLGRLSANGLAERRGLSARLLDWGQRRFVARFEAALGGRTVAACMEVFTALTVAQPQLAETTRSAAEILLGAGTRHVVVLAPRPGAEHEAAYFTDQLAAFDRRVALFVINKVGGSSAWIDELAGRTDLGPAVRAAVELALAETAIGAATTSRIAWLLGDHASGAPILAVPVIHDAEPTDVVQAVARFLAPACADGAPVAA